MYIAAVLLCWASVAATYTNETYQFLQDGNFELFGLWHIVPLPAWCDSFCARPPEWKKYAHGGDNFLQIGPNSNAAATQTFNYTKLNISFDACKLGFYVRVVNPIDSQFSVFWNGDVNTLDWIEYAKAQQVSADEWVYQDMDLKGMSDTLQLQLYTGQDGWLSIDDVTLICYNYGYFNLNQYQITILILIVLVSAVVMYYIQRRISVQCKCPQKCCCRLDCCRRRSVAKFIELDKMGENDAAFVD